MPTTFSTEHILDTISGNLPGGEVWSIGLRTAEATGVDSEYLSARADSVWNAFQAQAATAPYGFLRQNPPTVTLEQVVSRHVTELGVTDVLGSPYVTSNAGYGATQYQPDQIAIAVTLTTPKAGRSGKGRVYLPICGVAGLVNSRLSTLQAQGLADTMAAFIQAVGRLPPDRGFGPFRYCVQSRKGAGVPAPITGVAVGDVFDTQRRRRDKLREAYSTSMVVIP